jgi:hypothetical protein
MKFKISDEIIDTDMKIKVYKIGDCDWIASKSIEEAYEWYKRYYDEDIIKEDEIVRCDEEKEGMWYGIDLHEIRKFLKSGKSYKIKIDKRGDYDFVIYLTFQEVINLNNYECPYIIASTEY